MTGVGRTGSFLALEQWGVTPDLVVLAKGLSSGYVPLAAILVHDRVFEAFRASSSPYIGGHTYNCHPVTSAAGLAVLRYLETNKVLAQVPQKGALLGQKLAQLMEALPIIGNVRGRGLMWGMELVRDRATKQTFDPKDNLNSRIVRTAQEKGLLVYPVSGCADGLRGDGVLICPPLITTAEEIEFLIDALGASLAEMSREMGVPA
jgi:adenosylmethionine-8-amino-7-oxononanoate aminotransferase